MGIYIRGVKMPEKDGVWTLRIWGNGQVERLDGYHAFVLSGVKATDIPDHGRLVDASELDVLSWEEEPEKDFCDGVLFALGKLDELPVLIPAEGEEYE